MQFSLAASAALFSVALSLSTAQASPFDSDLLSRGTTPATSPVCNNFKAACQKQCGTQSTKTTCIDNGTGKLPQIKCRCGKGLLADKTAEVLLRIALTCAAKPVDSPTTGGSSGSPGTGTGSPGSPGTGTQTPVITHGPNLIGDRNPGFEGDLDATWNNQHCKKEAGGYKSNNKAVCVAFAYPGGVAPASLSQYFASEVDDTKTYTMSFWAKLSNGATAISTSPDISYSLGNDAGFEPFVSQILTTDWTLYTHDFPNPKRYDQQFVVIRTVGSASVDIDDVFIAEKTVSM